MTEVIQPSEPKTKPELEKVDCYLCNEKVLPDQSMSVPLTTGGNVQVHPSCMEFYLQKTSGSTPSSCGPCTGDAGCC